MTLDEKYRYRCNKSRINISVYIVIAMLSFFAVTTARYTKASSGSSVINVAKWNIEINGFSNQNQIEIPITKEGNSIYLSPATVFVFFTTHSEPFHTKAL